MKLIFILIFLKLCHCKISIPRDVFEVTDALQADGNRAGFANLKKISAGESTEVETFVTGGKFAKLGQFPYHALLYMSDSKKFHTCGGSLITYRTILTAAHCIQPFSLFNVYLGTISREASASVDFSDQSLSRSYTLVHKDYNSFNFHNDIGLIYLRTAGPNILNLPNVKVVTLPDKNDASLDLVGKVGTLSGFGVYKDGAPASTVLRYAKFAVLKTEICQQYFGIYVTEDDICLDGSQGVSACAGDSGGPLVLELTPGHQVVTGVVSFGNARGCELNYPSVMTNVASFLDWINLNKNAGPMSQYSEFTGLGVVAYIVIGSVVVLVLLLVFIGVVWYKMRD